MRRWDWLVAPLRIVGAQGPCVSRSLAPPDLRSVRAIAVATSSPGGLTLLHDAKELVLEALLGLANTLGA